MVHRSPGERLRAWLVTGPPGHLWSPLVDAIALGARWQLARLRRRAPR